MTPKKRGQTIQKPNEWTEAAAVTASPVSAAQTFANGSHAPPIEPPQRLSLNSAFPLLAAHQCILKYKPLKILFFL